MVTFVCLWYAQHCQKRACAPSSNVFADHQIYAAAVESDRFADFFYHSRSSATLQIEGIEIHSRVCVCVFCGAMSEQNVEINADVTVSKQPASISIIRAAHQLAFSMIASNNDRNERRRRQATMQTHTHIHTRLFDTFCAFRIWCEQCLQYGRTICICTLGLLCTTEE